MIRRWGARKLIQFGIAATLVGLVLLIGSVLERSFANHVTVSLGAPVVAPEPEPAAHSVPADQHGLSPEQITAAIRSDALWATQTDTTRSFDVQAVVHRDHSVTITEDIVQVFRADHHGIERLIPLHTNLGDNVMRSLDVSTSPGTPNAVKITDVTDGVSVRIGDPNNTITGAHAYRLTYVLEDLVTSESGGDVVRLDGVNHWLQEVGSFTYHVAAEGSPVSVRCFVGVFGGTSPCGAATATNDGGTFAAGRALEPGESFTVEVTYPAATFSPQAATTSIRGPAGLAMIVWMILYASVAIGFAISVLRSRRSRAIAAANVASTFGGPMAPPLADRMNRGSNASGTLVTDPQAPAPLEYVPPLNLDPASMVRLRDATSVAVPGMLAATLVDLAADRMVGLERHDKNSWTIRRLDQQPRPVRAYEAVLLRALLGEDAQRDLDTASSAISSSLDRFMHLVDEHLHELGLFTKKRLSFSVNKLQSGCLAAGMITVFALFTSVFGYVMARSAFGASAAIVLIGGMFAAAVLVVAVRTDAARAANYTPRGLGALFRLGGFERFFKDSEAVHARAAGNMGLYREYMGYAVALGHLDRWVGAMPADVAAAMVGTVPVAALAELAYHPVWLASTHSYAVAHAPKSSSAGSGGGFSGGGFSGGGGGGGGGGSW